MDLNLYCDYKENFNHCDKRDFDVKHPISCIMFDHIDWLGELDKAGKLRSCILMNIEKMLLCRTVYLGYDCFICPVCGNESIVPHSCHSRFCNACGVKYAKQLAAKASSFCLDVPHRHVVFTVPECLWGWFRQDRNRLNLLFIASRNTICAVMNNKIYKKAKKKKLKNTTYLYKNYRKTIHFGMISTIHTFGRDMKWHPHIHSLVAELAYDPVKNKIKSFNHFDFKKLKKPSLMRFYVLLKKKLVLLSKKTNSFFTLNIKLVSMCMPDL